MFAFQLAGDPTESLILCPQIAAKASDPSRDRECQTHALFHAIPLSTGRAHPCIGDMHMMPCPLYKMAVSRIPTRVTHGCDAMALNPPTLWLPHGFMSKGERSLHMSQNECLAEMM